MTLDSTDTAILNAILWDAKAPLQTIAKKLHLPLSTLHHRIKKIEDIHLPTLKKVIKEAARNPGLVGAGENKKKGVKR